jgi:hypothetical protein
MSQLRADQGKVKPASGIYSFHRPYRKHLYTEQIVNIRFSGTPVEIHTNPSHTPLVNHQLQHIVGAARRACTGLAIHSMQRKNSENLKQIFPGKEYRGLSPNFHIHVSVSELYIPMMELPFLLEEICSLILGIFKSLKDT